MVIQMVTIESKDVLSIIGNMMLVAAILESKSKKNHQKSPISIIAIAILQSTLNVIFSMISLVVQTLQF